MALNFKNRSSEKEILDDFELEGHDLTKNLKELEWVNSLLGGYRTVKSGMLKLLQMRPVAHRPIRIADLGCGSGDSLRALAKLGRKKGIQMELIGIDANKQAVNYAAEKSAAFPEITYRQMNIHDPEFHQLKCDVMTFNLFLHHFSDDEIVEFLKVGKAMNARMLINDLHRNIIGYYAFRLFSRLFRFSYIGRHDGKVSIRKAFTKANLESYLEQAGITRYQLRWKWAFRYQVLAY